LSDVHVITALLVDGTEATALITGPTIGVFDTVTLTEELAVKLPSISRATAASACVPSVEVVVFHENEYGEVATSVPTFTPSNWNCTPAIPALLDADAVTLMVPETVAPAVGDVTETEVDGGGGVPAERGTIPHIGVSFQPPTSEGTVAMQFAIMLFQFVAPVRRAQATLAPGAP